MEAVSDAALQFDPMHICGRQPVLLASVFSGSLEAVLSHGGADLLTLRWVWMILLLRVALKAERHSGDGD